MESYTVALIVKFINDNKENNFTIKNIYDYSIKTCNVKTSILDIRDIINMFLDAGFLVKINKKEYKLGNEKINK